MTKGYWVYTIDTAGHGKAIFSADSSDQWTCYTYLKKDGLRDCGKVTPAVTAKQMEKLLIDLGATSLEIE